MTTLPARTRPNGHAHEVDLTPGEVQCPYCGQSVSRKEFKEIQARMVAEEAARSAKREQQIKDGFAREMVKVEVAKKAEIEKARREATAVADKKSKLLRANQEATIAARLDAERQKGAKALAEAVTLAKLEHTAEKLRLETTLADLQRKLAAKTPYQLGEPGEVALYEALSAAFTEHQCRISRVPKGRVGPDLIVEVLDYGNVVIGSVIVDAKNHRRWSNTFISKIKSDQRETGASWAILASSVFPKGSQGLAVVEGVIVCDHALVPGLMEMLRRQLVEVHRQRLTAEDRDQKATTLLDFIGSTTCGELLGQFAAISDGLLALDQREISTHETTWRRRSELVRSLQAAHTEFMAVVDAIMNGTVESVMGEEGEASA